MIESKAPKQGSTLRGSRHEYTRSELVRQKPETTEPAVRDRDQRSKSPVLPHHRNSKIEHASDTEDHKRTDEAQFSTFQQRDNYRSRGGDQNIREIRRHTIETDETRGERLNRSQNVILKESVESRVSNIGHSGRAQAEVTRTKRVETVETKLVKDLEIRLISAFKGIIDVEKAVESSKQELSLRPDYSIKDHFKMMDTQGKGAINYNDFSNFIKRTKLQTDNLSALSRLFEEADTDRDGLISLVEFQDMISPKQKEYKILLNCRVERGAGCNYDYEKVE